MTGAQFHIMMIVIWAVGYMVANSTSLRAVAALAVLGQTFALMMAL